MRGEGTDRRAQHARPMGDAMQMDVPAVSELVDDAEVSREPEATADEEDGG